MKTNGFVFFAWLIICITAAFTSANITNGDFSEGSFADGPTGWTVTGEVWYFPEEDILKKGYT